MCEAPEGPLAAKGACHLFPKAVNLFLPLALQADVRANPDLHEVMRIHVLSRLALLALVGCATRPTWTAPPASSMAPSFQNPSLVPGSEPEQVWENVVDVVDDYFRVEHEEPVRMVGGILTEGRLDTFPLVGATLLEPWRHDSAGPYEKWESTLQSIRRRAVVRVMPAERGFWVEVVVFKELEELAQPEMATAGEATLRYDSGLTRVVNPIVEQPIEEGWIPLGRDTALEQRILGQILARFGSAPIQPVWSGG